MASRLSWEIRGPDLALRSLIQILFLEEGIRPLLQLLVYLRCTQAFLLLFPGNPPRYWIWAA